jgi:hypothetical protein
MKKMGEKQAPNNPIPQPQYTITITISQKPTNNPITITIYIGHL